MKNRPLRERAGFAWDGLRAAWRSEQSLRTQSLIALAVLPLLFILSPPLIWWALTGVMVCLVLAAELINTALEQVLDRLHPERHPRIKMAKDCAAAAVLLLSVGAVWVAAMMVLAVWRGE